MKASLAKGACYMVLGDSPRRVVFIRKGDCCLWHDYWDLAQSGNLFHVEHGTDLANMKQVHFGPGPKNDAF